MKWSISVRLQPGEEIVEQDRDNRLLGLKPIHSVILTNKRCLFRFNTLNTNMVQAFDLTEISSVRQASRLLIKYLRLTVGGKDYLFNVSNTDTWAARLSESIAGESDRIKATAPREPLKVSLTELVVMLDTLKKVGLLTEEEYEAKKKMII